MTRVLLAASAVAVVVALALPAAAGAGSPLVFFQSPSHNIGCAYSADHGARPFLRCDLAKVDVIPPKPSSCMLDYGTAFGLSTKGRARRLCAGDTVLNAGARVLAYGTTRRFGPFRCTSTTTGMRCTARSGHGFFLSRQRQKLF